MTLMPIAIENEDGSITLFEEDKISRIEPGDVKIEAEDTLKKK